MATGFQYNYTPLTYEKAQEQALQQLDPLYQQSIKGVQQAQYRSNLQAGNVASARGLGHSGLAADQLNKIAIASQGQIANLNATRMTQANTMAQQLVDSDKQYGLAYRGQLFNEYSDNRNFEYGKSRDAVSDKHWQMDYNYNKSVDDRNFKYQQGRDKVNDNWRLKEWNQMSPAEKARMQAEYEYSKKLKGSGGGGRGGRGRRGGNSGNPSGGYLPNVPQGQPLTYEEYMKMVMSGGYTASSNYGRGNGQVQHTTTQPEAKKNRPIMY